MRRSANKILLVVLILIFLVFTDFMFCKKGEDNQSKRALRNKLKHGHLPSRGFVVQLIEVRSKSSDCCFVCFFCFVLFCFVLRYTIMSFLPVDYDFIRDSLTKVPLLTFTILAGNRFSFKGVWVRV